MPVFVKQSNKNLLFSSQQSSDTSNSLMDKAQKLSNAGKQKAGLYIPGAFCKKNLIPEANFDYECFVDQFQVIPYVRQTQYAKKVKENKATQEIIKAKRYNKNKSDLASFFAWTGQGHVKHYPLALSFVVGYSNPKRNVMDPDNIQKAILDALQEAGVIPQDNVKHICGTDITRVFLSDRDYVWVGLRSVV